MKVLLVNGSPHAAGCTYTALSAVAGALNGCGVETKIFHIGVKPIAGCVGCGVCARAGKCVFDEDKVNDLLAIAPEYDGFVFGSPVHYAAASGAMTSFLDRCFYAGGKHFAHKPAACVVSCRRAGSTAALDQLNKYPTICQMPLVSGQYWNMVHGMSPDEVLRDAEGMQNMRTLGRNMAWLLRCIEAGRAAGIEPYPPEATRERTNFIR